MGAKLKNKGYLISKLIRKSINVSKGVIKLKSNNILQEAKELLIKYFNDNINNSKNKYCNKNTWMFAIKHSFRVEAYAMEIKDAYDDLSEEDVLTLQLAAIFHDIGNVVQRENHGEIGGEIIDKIYDDTEYISKSKIDKQRLINIIADHSNKENPSNNDIVADILKDADILDQIGAMSIFMHSTKYEYSSYDFYSNILMDIKNKEFSFCDKQYALLKTDAAKRIMKRKIEFIKNFQRELEYEIAGEINNKEFF